MYYFVDANGQQRGPIAAEKLISNGVNGDTLVWTSGMSQWNKAKLVPELRGLFISPPIPPIEFQQNSAYNKPPILPQSTIAQKPDNFMVWAVLSTICCCVPLGGYAIYCAAQVDTLYKKGDNEGAISFAVKAKQWAIISAICGSVANIISGICVAIANS